ncbi:MAG TPA: hypothetical protein VGM56_33405 [Byssovorax sp.]
MTFDSGRYSASAAASFGRSAPDQVLAEHVLAEQPPVAHVDAVHVFVVQVGAAQVSVVQVDVVHAVVAQVEDVVHDAALHVVVLHPCVPHDDEHKVETLHAVVVAQLASTVEVLPQPVPTAPIKPPEIESDARMSPISFFMSDHPVRRRV